MVFSKLPTTLFSLLHYRVSIGPLRVSLLPFWTSSEAQCAEVTAHETNYTHNKWSNVTNLVVLKCWTLFVWTDQNSSEVTYTKFFLCFMFLHKPCLQMPKIFWTRSYESLKALTYRELFQHCKYLYVVEPGPVAHENSLHQSVNTDLTCPRESSENQCDVERPSKCHCTNRKLVQGWRMVKSGRYKEAYNHLQRLHFCVSFNTTETSHLLKLISNSSGKVKPFTLFLIY